MLTSAKQLKWVNPALFKTMQCAFPVRVLFIYSQKNISVYFPAVGHITVIILL